MPGERDRVVVGVDVLDGDMNDSVLPSVADLLGEVELEGDIDGSREASAVKEDVLENEDDAESDCEGVPVFQELLTSSVGEDVFDIDGD